MTDDELDALFIERGFIISSFDELEGILDKCPQIIKVRYEQYGPKYCKFFILSISLRSWSVWVPSYSADK